MSPLQGGGTNLALAMHSKVTSLDPATTLEFLGGTMITGAMVSGVLVPAGREQMSLKFLEGR